MWTAVRDELERCGPLSGMSYRAVWTAAWNTLGHWYWYTDTGADTGDRNYIDGLMYKMTKEQSDPQQQAELRGLKVSKRSSRKSSTRFLSVCFLLPAWKISRTPHAVLETGLRFARIVADNVNHKNGQCPRDVQAATEDAANAAVVNGHHK